MVKSLFRRIDDFTSDGKESYPNFKNIMHNSAQFAVHCSHISASGGRLLMLEDAGVDRANNLQYLDNVYTLENKVTLNCFFSILQGLYGLSI